ncbi:MAG TPA: hypothetical protein VN132_02720 [Bdellovibrio sp.]|nr:hypothetical protein [Bdellovibrio sp.]
MKIFSSGLVLLALIFSVFAHAEIQSSSQIRCNVNEEYFVTLTGIDSFNNQGRAIYRMVVKTIKGGILVSDHFVSPTLGNSSGDLVFDTADLHLVVNVDRPTSGQIKTSALNGRGAKVVCHALN